MGLQKLELECSSQTYYHWRFRFFVGISLHTYRPHSNQLHRISPCHMLFTAQHISCTLGRSKRVLCDTYVLQLRSRNHVEITSFSRALCVAMNGTVRLVTNWNNVCRNLMSNPISRFKFLLRGTGFLFQRLVVGNLRKRGPRQKRATSIE